MTEWIDISEKTPPKTGYYLVVHTCHFDDKKRVYMLKWEAPSKLYKKGRWYKRGSVGGKDILRWANLPQPE
jgi:hypothetical protein